MNRCPCTCTLHTLLSTHDNEVALIVRFIVIARYINDLSSVDHWLGTWGGHCSTIPNALWALHHDNNVSHSLRANMMLCVTHVSVRSQRRRVSDRFLGTCV